MIRPVKSAGTNIAVAPQDEFKTTVRFITLARLFNEGILKTRWYKSGKFKRRITTEITAARRFYPAEEYHQKYLVKHPGGYTCHVLRD
jgi:peptide methionine sulfoxide reductase MsrA